MDASSSGGFWSAIIGAASDTAQNLGYRYLDQNISKHNTSYSANKSLANSTALTAFQSQVGRQDYKWQKALDYYYDENQYYDLAKRYAENSAKWNVTGLRNAGLNPILAATDGNFASTYGSGSSGGSIPSSGVSQSVGFSNSHGSVTPVSESVKDIASAVSSRASADLAVTDSQTHKAMRDPLVASAHADAFNKTLQGQILDAERNKVDAETDSIKANTAKTLSDIVDLKSGGNVSGFWNLLGRSMSILNQDRSDEHQKLEAEKAGLKSFFRNSAKDNIEELHKYDRDDFEKFLREQSEQFEREQRRRSHSFIHTR